VPMLLRAFLMKRYLTQIIFVFSGGGMLIVLLMNMLDDTYGKEFDIHV